MIGIVVPVHNEQDHLHCCLNALTVAAEHFSYIQKEAVEIVLVLDTCTDDSAAIATTFPVRVIEVEHTNVGMARHIGACWLLEHGARWLAFTDADSEVSHDWLSSQCELDCDAVCGNIRLAQWSQLPVVQRKRYLAHLRGSDPRRIYGANLGVCANAYRAVGGFEPRRAHEDVHLVRALQAGGFRIVWNAASYVLTSARCKARAPEGLGALLQSLEVPGMERESL
ncbi:glycosyltransferase [Halomonas sp. M20]|uniref:glycosyltransferase n=1 Tax=Halomonas sp. M20 TaxID=2763264 RepID=UPI001D09B0ED|nr:glycosyltransferase [Halomonas sp. M20]